jgi:hypothetical protein
MNNNKFEIGIDLIYYQKELRSELHSHIISLQILLENLNDTSTSNRVVNLGILPFEMSLIGFDTQKIIVNEINKSFISAIRSFQNFIDKLIAIIEFFKGEYKTEIDIKSNEEFNTFLQKKIDEIINKVSTDKSLNFPKKLQKFTIDESTRKILLSYTLLRNNLEHHKDISSNDTELNFFISSIYVNNEEFLDLNQTIQKGSTIELRKKSMIRLIKKGEKVEILEKEIFEIIFTLSELISLELINATYEILKTNTISEKL